MNNITILTEFKKEFEFELKHHSIIFNFKKTSIGPLGVDILVYEILKNSDLDMVKLIITNMYEDQLIRIIQRNKFFNVNKDLK
jgi:hypothetical protein